MVSASLPLFFLLRSLHTYISSLPHHEPPQRRSRQPDRPHPLPRSKQTLTLSKCGLTAFNINGSCKTVVDKLGGVEAASWGSQSVPCKQRRPQRLLASVWLFRVFLLSLLWECSLVKHWQLSCSKYVFFKVFVIYFTNKWIFSNPYCAPFNLMNENGTPQNSRYNL